MTKPAPRSDVPTGKGARLSRRRQQAPAVRRKESAVTHRRERVAELYLQGHAQHAIAAALGESKQTISNDLRIVHEWWRSSAVEKIDRAKARELARIDRREAEALAAWYRSIGEHATTTIKRTTVNAGNKSSDVALPAEEERTVKTEEVAGDPRFLAVAAECTNQRRAILGIDAPAKIGNPDGSALLEGLKIVYVKPGETA